MSRGRACDREPADDERALQAIGSKPILKNNTKLMPTSVELIPQDKSNACWLASSSMMRSWKDQVSYPLSDTLKVLDASGASFTQTYNADNGLSFAGNQKIVQTLGLTALPPASYTIDYFFSLLEESPIMAVIMFSANSNIAHMVVITSISGDRTPDGTTLNINDPLPFAGHTYTISFTDFLNKFESVVAYENNLGVKDLTSQLYYFPSSDTSTSAADSSSSSSDQSSSDEDSSSAETSSSTDDNSS
jgi:papain like cysteine protease AvrRpt2